MGSTKLKVKDFKNITFPSNKARSLALGIFNQKHFKHKTTAEKLKLIQQILNEPRSYSCNSLYKNLISELVDEPVEINDKAYELKKESSHYKIFGKPFITDNTIRQMDVAMQLPVAEKGALMPDAHLGYGLPVGGVLATNNEVIPYGIGVDIGCRMALSVYPVNSSYLNRYGFQLKRTLKEQTHFGIGQMQNTHEAHAVLDSPLFNEIGILKKYHGKAKGQIGTSGSGNHFVEFGKVVLQASNPFGLEAGEYLGLLSHSGSRGFGAAIANYYMRVAIDTCKLPTGAKHLAWLDLNTEAGQVYWMAMNLAGDYARACHEVIHEKISRNLGLKPIARVENHHNFAWKETQENGEQLIVHRKGATPAAKGQLGIIPGTMLNPGFIVSGLGNAQSLNSASHGAGRKVSRGQAKCSWSKSEMNKSLKANNITLFGGGVDESPMAYKSITDVMNSQQNLVQVEGEFHPRIVRMDKA